MILSFQSFITARPVETIIISFLTMLLAQAVKILTYFIKYHKLDLSVVVSTGGFPSSHSAFCISLCVSMGLFQWYDNGALEWSFVVACVFAAIIIHDAMGVRLEASKHAKILNRIAVLTDEEKEEIGYGKNGQLKELLGHKFSEVLAGIIFGIICAVIGFFICI